MKSIQSMVALVTLSLATSLAWAEETPHAHPGAKPGSAMTEKDKQMHTSKMQEKMIKMHGQMHKIMDAKDPKEREKLMQEHSAMMQEHMQMMHSMGGGMMQQGKMGSDAKGGKPDSSMKGM